LTPINRGPEGPVSVLGRLPAVGQGPQESDDVADLAFGQRIAARRPAKGRLLVDVGAVLRWQVVERGNSEKSKGFF
jgi:hypothetical protein